MTTNAGRCHFGVFRPECESGTNMHPAARRTQRCMLSAASFECQGIRRRWRGSTSPRRNKEAAEKGDGDDAPTPGGAAAATGVSLEDDESRAVRDPPGVDDRSYRDGHARRSVRRPRSRPGGRSRVQRSMAHAAVGDAIHSSMLEPPLSSGPPPRPSLTPGPQERL